MAKLERLLNLTAALLETSRPLTALELAERVPGYPSDKASFRRAFERDKDDLREMGVPITMAPLPDRYPTVDAYRVRREDYELPDPGLEPDELAAIHLATSAVRLGGLPTGETALWKLGGTLEPEAPPAAPLADLPLDDRLTTVFGAIADRRRIQFRYKDEERTVDPHRLDYRIGHWYLSALDHLRGDDRLYRIDRIDGAVTAVGERDAFPPSGRSGPGARLDPWLLPEEAPVTARLLVDADQAATAVHQVGPDRVEERRPDGSVVLRFDVTNRPGFRSLVLSFLDHAEILDPPELRADLLRWLDGIVAGSAPPK